MQKFESKEELLEKVLKKTDLLRCNINDILIGFELDQVVLDELLEPNSFYLSVEKSIKTECGLLTWTLSTGWIVVPKKDGLFQWLQFETLANFLERHGRVIPFKWMLDEAIEGLRTRMAREYLEELNQSLKYVNKLLNSEGEYNIDLLVSLAKDYRTDKTSHLEDIRSEIEKEIEFVQRYIPKAKNEKLVFIPYAL
ncbi:hypothetical protein U5N28_00405 [Lysinibacillus telephonicus]|uniref:Uncharacterized protein n=1 Tax=Lysinibacillus telephonicus TaxID=1714840 RepID=A0A431UY08_9BACI|nr:hypothetical protein [Lysinibacillus telephonicus]RTQ96497.1 hypothetical protein EKG35_00155 [Lysinibacillus telephonicus]